MSEAMEHETVPEGTWREDGMFLEFGRCEDTGCLSDPWSSGYNVIGAGGVLVDTEEDEDGAESDRGVVVYLQELDSGDDMAMRMTPDAARQLADRLNTWADDAETTDEDVEKAIEAQRATWYAAGGILAGQS